MSLDNPGNWAERPLGMRDVYPQQAQQRRSLDNRLLRFFTNNGFDMVSSGAFEYVDTLLRGRPQREAEDWIQLFDQSGRAIALRPDMTPSIARMAAPLISAGRTPIRWCYSERVYHRTNDPAALSWISGQAAQSTQVGVEWIGESGCAVDCDLVVLCLQALSMLELNEAQLVLSHAVLAGSFLQALGVTEVQVESLLQSLTRGDYVGFREQLAASQVPGDALATLAQLDPFAPESFPSDLPVDWQVTSYGQETLAAWNELCQLAHELGIRGVRDKVTFDLTLHRNLTYYSGIVFEVFAPSVGAPIAQGGRYDNLLAQFGSPCPAIGFTFEVERLLAVESEQSLGDAQV